MEDQALLYELNTRAQIAANRRAAGMTAQADQDDEQLLDITRGLDEHPDDYDGPCECRTCMSYS